MPNQKKRLSRAAADFPAKRRESALFLARAPLSIRLSPADVKDKSRSLREGNPYSGLPEEIALRLQKLEKSRTSDVQDHADAAAEASIQPAEVQAALLDYNEALRTLGDIDPEPYVARCRPEHHEEARGLLNTARLLKQTLGD